jgi:hypothetical protein
MATCQRIKFNQNKHLRQIRLAWDKLGWKAGSHLLRPTISNHTLVEVDYIGTRDLVYHSAAFFLDLRSATDWNPRSADNCER